VGLLARVGADVTGLVLEAVEGLVAEGALVGPREILAGLVLGGLLLAVLQEGRHEADGSGRHVLLGLLGLKGLLEGGLGCGCGSGSGGGVRVEYGGEVEGLHVISTRGGSLKVGEGGHWAGASEGIRAQRGRERGVGVGGCRGRLC
jgi:hypothetical protein